MRVLLVTEDRVAGKVAGAAKHAVVLGNALTEAGHEVWLLGRDLDQANRGATEFRGPLVLSIDLSGTGWQEAAFGVFNPLSRPHAARRIWGSIHQLPGRWDVIHYHGHNPFVGALAPPEVNFVHTLHDQGAECITKTRFREGRVCTTNDPRECASCAKPHPGPLRRLVSASAVRRVRAASVAAFSRHKALFVSRFVKYRFSERLSCPDASLHVVHNFVDVAAIRHALSEDVPPSFEHPDRIRVLISGRVDPAKGVAASLEALHARGPSGAEVLVLGDGPDLPALQRLDWHGTVRFRGWAGHPEVVRAAAEADVVVVPSVSEESCSTAILEALTVGTDVIALRRGGNPELRAYEQRRGQLTLVDSMDELAAATLARRRADSAKSVGEAADVRARLAEILAVYGAGRGAGSPANARVSR